MRHATGRGLHPCEQGHNPARGNVNDRPPTLPYATRDGSRARGLGWPIFLGAFQIFWLALFLFSSLFWEGDKNLTRDSLRVLGATVPSVCAFIVAYRNWRHNSRASRRDAAALCLCIWIAAGLVIAWI